MVVQTCTTLRSEATLVGVQEGRVRILLAPSSTNQYHGNTAGAEALKA